LTPFDLQRHAASDHAHGEGGARRDERDDRDEGQTQRGAILGFESVEEPLVPAIDADVDRQVGQQEQQRGAGPEPRGSPFRTRPEAKGARKEVSRAFILKRLFHRVFGHRRLSHRAQDLTA
jgi:hypothetical protein